MNLGIQWTLVFDLRFFGIGPAVLGPQASPPAPVEKDHLVSFAMGRFAETTYRTLSEQVGTIRGGAGGDACGPSTVGPKQGKTQDTHSSVAPNLSGAINFHASRMCAINSRSEIRGNSIPTQPA